MDPVDAPKATGALVRVALAVLLTVGVALLLVRLLDVLLLAFGAVLVAVLLHAIARPLQRRLRLSRYLSLTIAVVVVALSAALLVWVFGRQAGAQLASLSELLPQAWKNLSTSLAAWPPGALILREMNGWSYAGAWLFGQGPQLAANAVAMVAGSIIVVFAGLYLAFHPETYLRGALLLMPPRARPRAAEVAEAIHVALRHWLVGLLFSMALVGVTVTVGLWLAGVPNPLALGIIAGVGQVVPLVGPLFAMIPGLLAAASEPTTLAWAVVVYAGAGQLEANVFTPLVLRRLAQLPMGVTLFAVLATGVLMGPLGVLFATPLAVTAYVIVKMVYVEGIVGGNPSSGPRPGDRPREVA